MSDAAPTPPQPQPDAYTQPFWDACQRQSLEAARCEDCGHCFLPPGPCCPQCWSAELSVCPLSGRGRVYSFGIYRRSYHPGLPAPYVVALVELEEGPRLVSNVVGCMPEDVRIDMPLRVRFEASGEFVLPRFEPAEEEGARR